jgi:hypothetical protein
LLLWRRRRRRHGQQLRRKRQRQLRRRRWWGAEGLEQLVGVRTEPGAEVRKAPAGVDRLLFHRRRRRQERGEGVLPTRRRRRHGASAAEAHDGVQVPVVGTVLLLHWDWSTGERSAVVGLWKGLQEEARSRRRR